jgi:imidazole glycerol-phosphate synthase subunit HisF
MLTKRIIPCLDVKDGRTVKGTQFVNLRDAGDPVELASRYSDEGADELVLLDISASIEGRKTFRNVVEDVAKAVQIPFTVGGGISTVEDILTVLDAGADKVSLNTAIVSNPYLLDAAAAKVGSQSIVAAIDAKRADETWLVYVKGGSEPTRLDAVCWAKEAVERGAGELLLTSMDRDGTKAGYDIELLKIVSDSIEVPLIASGGAGEMRHLKEAIVDGRADAVLAASIFHYQEITLTDIKQYLRNNGVAVRL